MVFNCFSYVWSKRLEIVIVIELLVLVVVVGGAIYYQGGIPWGSYS